MLQARFIYYIFPSNYYGAKKKNLQQTIENKWTGSKQKQGKPKCKDIYFWATAEAINIYFSDVRKSLVVGFLFSYNFNCFNYSFVREHYNAILKLRTIMILPV